MLSFVYLGIYWSNHHHMLQATRRINGAMLWANLHLLFWLSLVPFVTSWMGENHFAAVPTARLWRGAVLLRHRVHDPPPHDSVAQRGVELAARAPRSATIGRASSRCSCTRSAIPLAFVHQSIAHALYAIVALIWLVPDRRIESRMQDATGREPAA